MDRRTFLLGLAAAAAGCGGVDRARDRLTGLAASPSPSATSPPTASASPTSVPAPRPTPSPAATSAPPSPPPATGEPLVQTLVCRADWAAAAARPGGRTHTIGRLMVHHSAVALSDADDAAARFRQHQGFHQDQGWVDIAYHLGVDRRGQVYDLRDRGIAGDTFTDYDPAGWLLVLAEGNFDQQQPTDAQLEGVARALAWGAGAFGADPAGIAGHRDRASTSCPGDAMYARLGELRTRTAELVAAGGVGFELSC